MPDPAKPHGIWEIIDPKLLESMPEDVLVHAWFEENGHPIAYNYVKPVDYLKIIDALYFKENQ